MAKLVVLITARVAEGHAVGEAWQEEGAPGVTFLEGYGLHNYQRASKSVEVLPGTLSMTEVLRQNEEHSLIVLSAVEDYLVDRLIRVAESLMGDMYKPDAGILFTLDLGQLIGLRVVKPSPGQR